MKIKVKGLVFVGFAAAIMSASAVADPSGTTITSLAYTESTYQKLNNMTKQGNESGNILGTGTGTDDKYPSEKAVATAIGAISNSLSGAEVTSNKLNGTSGQTIGGLTAGSGAGQDQVMYPSAAAVKEYAAPKSTAVTHTANTAAGSATKPVYINASGVATETTYTLGQNVPVPASGDDSKFLKGDGTWGTPTDNDTTYDVMGAATADANGSTGLVPAPAAGDQAKVLNGSGDWVDLPTVNNATLTVQLNGTTVDTFTANAATAKTINITGVEKTSEKLDGSTNNTIADYSNNTTKYTSAKAVYDFVTNQPSAGIPAKSTTNCTAEHPCALVAETSGFHWRVMAISANQSPAAGTCGDATGNCGDSGTPSGGDD